MTELLQRLIRWPLWSWRNLTITAVIVLASLAGLGRVSTALQTSPRAPRPAVAPATTDTPTPTPAPPSPSVPTPSAVGLSSTEPDSQAVSPGRPVHDCREAASAFTRAWARPNLPQAEWLAGLTPYAAGPLRAQLATSDPARVPATRVLTDPKPVTGATKGEAFRVVTDAGPVIVRTVATDGVCVVRDIEPDDTVQGAPTPPLGPTPGKRG